VAPDERLDLVGEPVGGLVSLAEDDERLDQVTATLVGARR
jgi:hypothetical protein